METLAQGDKIDMTHLSGMIANKAESQELGACDANDFKCSKATVETQPKKEKKEETKPAGPAPEPSVLELKMALKKNEFEQKEALAQAKSQKKTEQKTEVKKEAKAEVKQEQKKE